MLRCRHGIHLKKIIYFLALISMEMLPRTYIDTFRKALTRDMGACLETLAKPENGGFEYLLEAGAVYSSNIEGNTMDVNSFMNAKLVRGPKPKEYDEITDLKAAYDFAREHPLTEENLLNAHAIMSRGFLSEGNMGAYRQDKVGVFSESGLVYLAAPHDQAPQEMQALFAAIEHVISEKPDATEALYFAALAHLQFAHIHPFADGNGRAARLLEKWLLVALLGERAWLVESERYYWEHRDAYYAAINLGVNYYELDYERCVPFILLLGEALCARTDAEK